MYVRFSRSQFNKTARMYFTKILVKIRHHILTVSLFGLCVLFVLSRYTTEFPLISSEGPKSYIGNLNKLSRSGDPIKAGSSQVDENSKEFVRPPRWTYSCHNNACTRQEADEEEPLRSLDVCWLTCGTHGSMWPYPRKHGMGSKEIVEFIPVNIDLSEVIASTAGVKRLITDAFKLKRDYLLKHSGIRNARKNSGMIWPLSSIMGSSSRGENIVKVSISTTSHEEVFTLGTDESYQIKIEEESASDSSSIQLGVKISGATFFGVRHGIETLSQLIAYDKNNKCFQILKSFNAVDTPKYSYRGILIDSGRNFVPLDVIRRVVDGMGHNKLNVLHWHLTDSNSFTFYSNRVPQMTQYGAFSEDQIYYPSEIAELVKYARIRGVKIIPELDTPSHAGNGWQFGKKLGLGELAFYVNVHDDSWPHYCYQPPCGVLNPLNINTYNVLEQIYADMSEVFDKDLFHMGGDELHLASWTSQSETRKRNPMELWKHFQTEAFARLTKQYTNATAILWSSKLTEAEAAQKYLDPNDYIIQTWDPSNSAQIHNLLREGFSLIISFVDKFYLDWGVGTWLGKEQLWKYHMWQTLYEANLFKDNEAEPKYHKQILGGEAPLWGEKVGPSDLEVKLWPRAAALAENLWSNPSSRGDEVYTRLNYHNYRLRQLGIPTGQLQPESCLHYNGHCRNPNDRYP